MHVAGSGQRDVSSVDIVSVILDDIITVVTGEFRYFFPSQALFKTFFALTLFGNRKYPVNPDFVKSFFPCILFFESSAQVLAFLRSVRDI